MARVLFIYKVTTLDVREPLGILSLSAVLEERAHKTDLLIVNFERDLLAKVVVFKPDVIGYSVVSGFEPFYLRLNSALRRKISFISVFGGPHATFFPEMINNDGVDIICRGEGEGAILDIAGSVDKGKSLKNTPNLWIKEDSVIYKNEPRALTEDLDNLPFPNRDIVYKYSSYKNYKFPSVITGRGCPFNCPYCFNHSMRRLYQEKEAYVRKHSVEYIIKEIQLIKRDHKIKYIRFDDDVFVFPKYRGWLREFAERYPQEVDIPFSCSVRADQIDEEMVSNLAKAGCYTIIFAIESGNYNLRKNLLRRNISDQSILEAKRLLDKHKIRLCVEDMLGLPREKFENALETFYLNRKLSPGYAWASIFQPYPCTDLYEYCLAYGYIDKGFQNIKSYHKKSLLRLERKGEFENLHKLFAIGVNFFFISVLIKLLVKLPLNRIYNVFYILFKAYAYFFRVRMGILNWGIVQYHLTTWIVRPFPKSRLFK